MINHNTMKKIFRYAAALMALSAAFACQREALTDENLAEEVDVTFNISTESAIDTRSIGYADTYEKELLFYVYKDGVLLDQVVSQVEDFQGVADLDAKVTVRLVKGQDYDFVFWAQVEGMDYYDLDPAYPPVVTVDYNGLNANEESRDAFYAAIEGFHVSANMLPEKVKLQRPFAQINVGTTQDDVDAAKLAGVVIDKTSVTLSNVADQLDLFTGEATGNVDVEAYFQAAYLPQQELIVYSSADYPTEHPYYYLSMNYILVADQTPGAKEMLDSYEITFWQGTQEINSIEISSVPVRRNWRTNIIGQNILTDYATFEITIDPRFYGEHNGGIDGLPFEEFPYDDQNQQVDNNLYLAPGQWAVDNARFAVYYFEDGVGNGWVDMTDSDSDGIYEVDKSLLKYDNIIFCRMSPGSANAWSNKWNQTANLTIPDNGNNLFTITQWDNNDNANWSVKQ